MLSRRNMLENMPAGDINLRKLTIWRQNFNAFVFMQFILLLFSLSLDRFISLFSTHSITMVSLNSAKKSMDPVLFLIKIITFFRFFRCAQCFVSFFTPLIVRSFFCAMLQVFAIRISKRTFQHAVCPLFILSSDRIAKRKLWGHSFFFLSLVLFACALWLLFESISLHGNITPI